MATAKCAEMATTKRAEMTTTKRAAWIRRLDSRTANFEAKLRPLLAPAGGVEVEKTVAEIIARIRRGGLPALRKIAARLDGWRAPSAAGFEIPTAAIDAAPKSIAPELLRALTDAARRIERFHRAQKKSEKPDFRHIDGDGNIAEWVSSPLARVGVYAPGGRAAYPSTVLMCAIPARVAGVGEIALATPPAANGEVAPAVLAAAKIARVDRVFRIGGAQAICALAWGIGAPKVDKIAGPGNAFVAAAKRQLFGEVGIDSIAGPSEVLIVADEAAPPRRIAFDMLAQAEHDESAQAILLSPAPQLLRAVERELQAALAAAPRARIAARALAARGALILCRDLAEAQTVANRFAPEHAQVMAGRRSRGIARGLVAASIFVGVDSSAVFGDYGAGPNHVLPTGGGARFSSPLGVADFMRKHARIEIKNPRRLAATAAALAAAEGLFAHADSAALRRQPAR